MHASSLAPHPSSSSSPGFVGDGSVAPEAVVDENHDGEEERSTESSSLSRQVIADTLRSLRAQEQEQREREQCRREVQDEITKSVIKVMHLDSSDFDQVNDHTQKIARQNAIAGILKHTKTIEAAYQHAKKELASIPDKKLRHEQVQREKRARDDTMALLRERLQGLDPSVRLLSSLAGDANSTEQRAVFVLPSIDRQVSSGVGSRSRKKTPPPNYREVMEAIRCLQKERPSLPDPYMANLKVARLWRSISDHDRALEDYRKASKSLSEKQLAKLAEAQERSQVLAQQRLRKREALHFLFSRALLLKEREEAAALMTTYLDLSLASERLKTVSYLEGILRKQAYVEDPSLTTSEAVTQSIFLTDLRFRLLEEMLATAPTDAYLLDAVTRMHVRLRAFEPAKRTSDRFVRLPEVKRCSLFASFAAFECGDGGGDR
ncbi:hypothetical protein PybrP1_006623 [[Pythium] brassicae (nom. inval.)]|nr:hypothetical protein PybrP1_006623 [[Pythium] brassicae (nom. inval.)]